MQLGDILDELTLDASTARIEIVQVDDDSRLCVEGSLFFVMPTASASAGRYALAAVSNGATCVVSSEALPLEVPVVVVPTSQLRALCAHASAAVVRHPEAKTQVVGVTGTNGKTTVTTLVAEIARAMRWNGANIGTLTSERTTPAGPELFRSLARLVEAFDPTRHPNVVALEVSSHAIDQGRIEGLPFTVVAFTNLSHDHLDYHGSMEEYFKAKASLFSARHAQRAVIWTDDPYGQRLADLTSLPATLVSRQDAHDVVTTLSGSTFFWRGHLVNSPLVGDYNVDNALVAMSILADLGADVGAVAGAIGEANSIPGRFDVLRGGGVTVVVDYAHTPEGLRRLLSDVRSLSPASRVVTVFGCGGDRDAAKRPEMGRIATMLSDFTLVTSDNPRHEDPDAIIDAIMSGALPSANVTRQSDRRLAIQQALEVATAGDVVVIAGKGHETTQVMGDQVIAFSDREVALEALR